MSRRRLPKVVAKATEWARAQLIGPGNAGVCEWAAIERAVAFKMAVKRMTLKAERTLARATSGVSGWWRTGGMQMVGTGSQELGTGAASSQEPGLVLQQEPNWAKTNERHTMPTHFGFVFRIFGSFGRTNGASIPLPLQDEILSAIFG